MAFNRASSILKCRDIFKLNFSTSFCLSNYWRVKQGLERCPRKFGPLTNLPDYSFVDGRPVPLSLHRKRKLDLQKKFCERIIELNSEIDIGLQKYYERIEEEKQNKERILKNRLKPKGSALLKKTHHEGKSTQACE